MAFVREPRKTGEVIILGNRQYRIEGLAGCGGSAMVYYASYPDGLNPESLHRVLVKELFPWHPKGYIYREEGGNIRCRPEGKDLLEYCRERFYEGNKANLTLLERFPEQVSGNLDSCQAYGTCYSVLPFHGGCCLQQLLEGRGNTLTLKESIIMTREILNALDCFHQNGILHLDISPDNIMMLPGRALLIDYNSVRPMGGGNSAYDSLDVKEGYSAPEIILEETENIGAASDLYSVSAVWFRMLTGQRRACLPDRGIRKTLAEKPGALRHETDDAVNRVGKILGKGLHLLARQRYQSAAELSADLEKLLLWLEEREPVSNARWEADRKAWEGGGKREKRKQLLQNRRRSRKLGLVAAICSVAVIFLAAAAWKEQGGKGKEPAGLSAEESRAAYAAAQRLEINMGVLSRQIGAQNIILETASGKGAPEGEKEEAEFLVRLIRKELAETDSVYVQYRDGSGHVEKLEGLSGGGENVPVSLLNEIYEKPQEMKGIMEQAVPHLESVLCQEEFAYDAYGRKEESVNAYREYLDAYTAVCYLEYSLILDYFRKIGAEEAAGELMEAAGELSAFWDCINTYSLGGMKTEELIANLKAARRNLEYAEMQMISSGLMSKGK